MQTYNVPFSLRIPEAASSYVILANLFNLSEPQCLHLDNGNDIIYQAGFLGRLNSFYIHNA